MKVAIVGLSPSTHKDASWSDPDWELWGLPWDAEGYPRFNRLFEMHVRNEFEKRIDRLKESRVPIYMQQHFKDIPNSIKYPFDAVGDDVFKHFPRRPFGQEDWYNSSIAYMLALAIHEKAEEIGLWAVDVRGSGEYENQVSCLEFLIGFALGRGIKVFLPRGPTVLNSYRGITQRYGFI